ncbi:P-loop containing nucleoside triphosphate hydrolase protein [Mycena metata]|uniref:P-loop containing nucleoside triphosphate hydrolase protein n=1 Tax=Mycena metata TaxID=1033252 RepID=A0AAD7MTB0_9AGAR|nr:P-loop containing nucleoside triphosphate hydrolase protein [Mycena metata]
MHTLITPLTVIQMPRKVNSCPAPSRIFHGRGDILVKMHTYFTQTLNTQHLYVLHGLGGAGKTQIALSFIRDSSLFTDTFFLDASMVETINKGFKDIAVLRNVGKSSNDALTWLVSRREGWLLFFDNADDPNPNLNKFLPKCGHGNIIITSRNPELRIYGSNSQVSDMEENEAVTLLLKSAAQEVSPMNEKLAAEIVKALSYLPLAIVQAGAFIAKSGSLNNYLALYSKNHNRLLKERPAQTHDDYAWTVYTTWQISFDRLSSRSAQFLQLCSFLHRGGISEDLFSRAASYDFPPFGPLKEELQQPLNFLAQFLVSDGEWDTFAFMDVTNEIKSYSLMDLDPERNVFSIHPLVHSWCRTTLSDLQSSYYDVYSIVGMSVEPIPVADRQLACLKLLPHAESSKQTLQHTNTRTSLCCSLSVTRHQ